MSMFGSSRKISDEDILAKFYDYVLNEALTDRERKIGLLGKAELEKKHYSVAVVNRVMATLQLEAVRQRSLTPEADAFYHELADILDQIQPIGTNRAAITAQNAYMI